MGNFNEIVPRRINISPARVATLAEAQSAPVPFDKYYAIKPTRPIKKLETFFILKAASVAQATAKYQGRLIFQYNFVAPYPFYILTIPQVDKHIGCVITVKWRVGTTVYRYFIWGWQVYDDEITPDVHDITNFPVYTNQQIPVNCVFELWSAPANNFALLPYGLLSDFKFKTSFVVNPNTPDDIENDVVIGNPINCLAEHTTFPLTLPLNNPWPDVVYNSN